MPHGLFFTGHRAVHDCEATLEVLARLLETARRPGWRIWAVDAPFYHKDNLETRGYRLNGDANWYPCAWYIDVAEEARAVECAFLCEGIYGYQVVLPMRRVTTQDRLSVRG
jgi:DNA polymerase-3 subunit epsilon